ncbi:7TM diverse intracellular signaling domain-containing protein [Arcobacter sp.]|uniref:7TM diverse intracellular signaling domain-containing protein n=1 Tax=unclassified Arcobacter TaxID=2593671 RepID=UPI003AFFE2AB
MRIYYLIILLVSFSSVFATEIDLSNKNLTYEGKKMSYFEDKDSSYTINKIKELNNKSFTKQEKEVFLRFFTDSTYWFKFDALNETNNKLKRYFVFDTPWIDTINIYIYDNQNRLTTYKLGTLLPFKERSMKINLLNQAHNFSKGKSTVYLQIKTRDPFIIPFSILSEKNFYKKIMNMDLIVISTYSIVFAIFIFNILIFIIARYKPYFYYSLYLLSYLLMSLSYDSHTFKYIFYDYPNIQNWMQSLTILFYLIFSLLFAKSFLELKDNFPKINSYTNYILIGHIGICILASILGYKYTIFYASCITPLFSIYMLFLGVYSYLKGNKKAVFFTLATIFGCTGAFLTASIAASMIDYNWYLFKGVDIGVSIDSILFSIALAYRYTSLNLILENTKKEVTLLNKNLEKKVEERTKELDIQVKNKTVLLKELSHRIKNNLQIISALLYMDKDKMLNEKDKDILDENIKRIKSISILYENFLEIENPNKIELKKYIEKIISEIKNSYSSLNISYDLKIHKILLNQNSLIPIGLVMNELILNSVKYAFKQTANPKISICFSKDDKNINFIYKDNGIGANIDKVESGFGFSLIKTLISFQLNGKINCKNNEGLEYNITLPKNSFLDEKVLK